MTESRRPWVTGGASDADPDARESVLTTTDGRNLGVSEYGPADGLPVFDLHGTPDCRVVGKNPDHPNQLEELGIRLVAYDRAGYGKSSRHAGRRVVDVAADVETIADALGIEQFAVMGGSGGGPHSLAVAARLPGRVTRCACVVGVAPFGDDGLAEAQWLAGMTEGNVKEFTAAVAGEATVRPLVEQLATDAITRAVSDPANLFGDDYELSDGDRALMADERRFADRVRSTYETFRHGVDGWVDDLLAFTSAWGFEVSELTVPATIWFGTDDTLVPAAHGEWLARNVPHVGVIRIAGGHMELVHRIGELYSWLIGGPVPADADLSRP